MSSDRLRSMLAKARELNEGASQVEWGLATDDALMDLRRLYEISFTAMALKVVHNGGGWGLL